MLTRFNRWLQLKHDWGIFFLRLFIGLRLFYGVIDNILNWDRMKEFSEFLQAQGFPFPLIAAVVSVYAQFICALLILIGYKIRLASFLMVFNFTIAIIMVHHADSIEEMTPALAMLFGSITFLFTGAGKISIEKR